MTSAFLLFLFLILFSCTTALDISVPSSPVAGAPTTITWTCDDPDDPAQFDLRFVVNKTDVGLAVANVETENIVSEAIEVGDGNSGDVNVTFPEAGSYILMAVTGAWPNYVQVASSAEVTVVEAPTDSSTASSPTATSSTGSGTGTPSSSPSPKSSSTSSPIPISASQTWSISPVKRAIIIAFSTLGALLFLLIGAIIAFVISRRNMREADERRRWTFQQDKMVLQRDDQGPTMINIGPGVTPPRAEFDVDLERGVDPGPGQVLPLPSPNGPRTPHYLPYHFVAAGNVGSGNR